MKVRMTKKRLAQLSVALSMDEILYAKFQRLNRELSERERRFRARRQVKRVVMQVSKGIARELMIVNVFDTGNGLSIEVR